MAAQQPPTKKAHLALETPDNTESSSSSEEESESEEEGDGITTDHELQVEFEARTPESCDFHGISRLLRQTFLRKKSSSNEDDGEQQQEMDISSLSDFIIAQRNIGSVITQSHDDGKDEEEEFDDEFDDLQNEVFGMMTLIRISPTIDNPASKQIMAYLYHTLESVNPNSNNDAKILTDLLRNPSNNIGFIISERIINIPAQISVPLYETLYNEVKKAVAKNLPFNFTHYLLISKILCPIINNDDNKSHHHHRPPPQLSLPEQSYINAEEEVFVPECDLVIDITGKDPFYRSDWSQDTQFLEKRKLLLFRSSKLETIVTHIKNAFPIP